MFTSSAFVYRSNYIFPLPQQDNATEHRAFTLLSLILIFSSKFQRKERLNVGKFSCVLIDWLIDRWFLAFCFLKDIFLIHSDTFIKIYASVTKSFNVFSGKLNQKDKNPGWHIYEIERMPRNNNVPDCTIDPGQKKINFIKHQFWAYFWKSPKCMIAEI